jgi:hypothetical protein
VRSQGQRFWRWSGRVRPIKAQRAELNASSEYTARMEREAQAEPEPDVQAETVDEIEIEL